MIGDYRVIMGNTGGDNRVEFAYRAPHAIWWESPSWSGLAFKAMYAPGQNRSGDNSNLASGEQDRLRGLTYENEQLHNRLEIAERQCERLREELARLRADNERHLKERVEVAEQLSDMMNQLLLRLRPTSS